jgi:hypothetical protein
VYEKGNDKTAIELLAGHDLLLDYLKGRTSECEIRQALADSEADWLATSRDFWIYK